MEGTPDRGSLGLVTGPQVSSILAGRVSPFGFTRRGVAGWRQGCQRLDRFRAAAGRTMPNPTWIGPLKRVQWREPLNPSCPAEG